MSCLEDCENVRQQVIGIARQLSIRGLNINSSGNISLRIKKADKEGFLITPSGVAYELIEPSHLVFIEMNDGFATFKGELRPSSEWELHEQIYRKRQDIGAVVHTHSCHATALSCMEESIPAFHYMVALANAKEIACAKYATFGSSELAKETVKTLGSRSLACLLSHHGVIACGSNIEKAFALALEVENLAHMWLLIKGSSGSCKLINEKEMDKILEKFKHHGQNG